MGGRTRLSLSGGLAALVAAVATSACVGPSRVAVAEPHSAQKLPTIVVGGSARKVPGSFFGLSVEYPELPIYERFLPSFERILSLLRVGGDGPLILRIGGNSADLTYWNPGSRSLPTNAYVLSPNWFEQLRTLILQSHLRVLLDLNLRYGTDTEAGELVRQAWSRFPAGSIIGLEVGNEPDQYGNGYSPPRYVSAFKRYAATLHRIAPGLPLLGPAVTSTDNNFNWLRTLIDTDRAQLGVLDGHQYPLAACARPGDPGYPTVAKVLGSSLTAGLAAAVKPAVVLAHQRHRHFRLDETNSVTCGGTPGVSNTFSTALWAPDALLSLLNAGLDSVNVHIRPTKINGPLVVGSHGFSARPLFYGLLLFTKTVSPGGQLLHVTNGASGSAHLSVWAARAQDHSIHVLLINKGKATVTVRLRLPPSGAVMLERMLAASADATDGVTLAGQKLGSDGRMQGTLAIRALSATGGSYQVTIPAVSAALVSAAQH